MNAIKLANEIKNALDPKAPFIELWVHDLLEESEEMLRQQQAEIEALKVAKFHLEADIGRLEDQVNDLLIAKDIKNECK